MNKERNWTVLFVGGASGSGKSSVAYELGRYYNVNVVEVDDISLALKAMTTQELLPAIHYWNTGVNWMDIGIDGNVQWLIDVSKEIMPALKAIVEDHLKSNVPVIIEGDFIHPELLISFDNLNVKSIFIYEPDKNQIVQNYHAREGGNLQNFRADVSSSYGNWLVEVSGKLGLKVIESRPWDTVVARIIDSIY